jgi:hypothetical protein
MKQVECKVHMEIPLGLGECLDLELLGLCWAVDVGNQLLLLTHHLLLFHFDQTTTLHDLYAGAI